MDVNAKLALSAFWFMGCEQQDNIENTILLVPPSLNQLETDFLYKMPEVQKAERRNVHLIQNR